MVVVAPGDLDRWTLVILQLFVPKLDKILVEYLLIIGPTEKLVLLLDRFGI